MPHTPSQAALRAVFAPARPRALACLRTLTAAPESVCREVLSEDPPDPIAGVIARRHARRGVAFEGPVDLREAWEMVAPEPWIGDARRAFTTPAWGRPGDAPASHLDALLLASDPAGVTAAESLAADALRRMIAAGVEVGVTAATAKMIWWCESPERFRPRFHVDAESARRVEALLGGAPGEVATRRAAKAADELRRALAPRVGGCAWDAAELLRWSLLCEPLGERNPFTPLWAIWESGYAFDGFVPEGCVLVAPSGSRASLHRVTSSAPVAPRDEDDRGPPAVPLTSEPEGHDALREGAARALDAGGRHAEAVATLTRAHRVLSAHGRGALPCLCGRCLVPTEARVELSDGTRYRRDFVVTGRWVLFFWVPDALARDATRVRASVRTAMREWIWERGNTRHRRARPLRNDRDKCGAARGAVNPYRTTGVA